MTRTASNGTTRHTYKIQVIKSEAHKSADEQQKQTRLSGLLGELHEHVATSHANTDLQYLSPFTIDGRDVLDIRCVVDGKPYDLRFDPDTQEYELHIPEVADKIRVTVQTAAAPRNNHKASVPVVVLCFGGGPNTLYTLDSAGSKPIIVVRGSERAAQFIDDWCSWNDKLQYAGSVQTAMYKVQRRDQAELSLRTDACKIQRPPVAYEDILAEETKPPWWEDFRSRFPSFHFLHCWLIDSLSVNQPVRAMAGFTVG